MRKPGNIVRYPGIVIWALIAFCSLAFGQSTTNQWSSHGPYGGAMSWFAIAPGNPNLIYAARAETSDIFKSVDGGVTWIIANSQMPTRRTDALTFDPTDANTIYVAAVDSGSPNETIYKTTNGGVNWTALNTLTYAAYNTKLIADPQTSANLYAVTQSRIFQSVDGGANWNVFGPGPTDSGQGQALAIDPNTSSILYVSFYDYQTHRERLYKSTDRGATWHASDVGIDTPQNDGSPLQIAVARGNSELIYAATNYSGVVFRSIDGGAHWSLVYAGSPNNGSYNGGGIDTLVVDPINQNVAYAGTRGRGVLKTTDGGASWSQFNAGLSNTIVYGLAIDPANDNRLFAATDGPGAFISTNGGAGWNELSLAQRSIFVRSLATTSDPGVVYAGGVSVFKSANSGATWTTYPAATTSSGVNSLVADPDNGNVVYALMTPYGEFSSEYGPGGSVFKSTDGGVSWKPAKNGLGDNYVTKLVIDPLDHNTLYAGAWNGIFKTTDAGASWNMVRGSICCVIDLAISPANNRTMYASAWYGDYRSTIFKTTDGGANWANIGGGLPDYVIPLAVDPKNPDVVYTVDGSIYRSNDGGVNWSQLSTDSGSTNTYVSTLVVNPNNSNDLFAARYDYSGVTTVITVIRSTDGGASWSSLGDGWSGSYIIPLAIDRSGQYLYLGTSAGVFSIEISPSTPPPTQIDNAQFFVRQHYLDFLGREPDQAGWDFWTNEITSCGIDQQCIEAKNINVSASFFLSIEFQRTGYLAYRFYKAAYGNLPGAPVPIQFSEFRPDTQRIGLGVVVSRAGWETVLENNQQAFASEFVQRSRFTSAYPISMTPKAFVQTLFANAGVIPSESDLEAAVSEFGGVLTTSNVAARARALRRVAENSTFASQESNRAFVLMQYFGYLRRNPNDAPDGNFEGFNFWLNKLNQFNGDYNQAEMVKAFLSSSEYRHRFGQ
jgi:photosystem II stability/assembly factor-like uncharacterized protein